jgi:uncharacterized RDD family membrane protein YckC
MNSSGSGEILPDEVRGCQSEPLPTGLPLASSPELHPDLIASDMSLQNQNLSDVTHPVPLPEAQPDAWRDELSARLNRFRARRRIRPPRYPSLSLQFEAIQPSPCAQTPAEPSSLATLELRSQDALALDPTADLTPVDPTTLDPGLLNPANQQPSVAARDIRRSSAETPPAGFSGAKIIEFPRSAWAPPPPPPDQLAEPVSDRPRILEAPESAPPAPALGGITLDARQREQIERQPGIDLPLQGASLPRRILATTVDGLIVAAASALFGVIFWKVAAVRPPQGQVLGLAAGIPCLLWAAYQYLLTVYAARTPGLRVAGLELTRFDGTSTSRSLRRCRVLAAYLSAASLGMGYAWVFLDEDLLCWHDRITHTYLAPKAR